VERETNRLASGQLKASHFERDGIGANGRRGDSLRIRNQKSCVNGHGEFS
jgi:hypothetical protein